MIGIAFNSPDVIELLIDKVKYKTFLIECFSKKLVRKNKEGTIVERRDEYNPKKVFETVLNDNTKRGKVILVQKYETLKLLPNNKNIKYIIFDAPQILVKKNVTILDAKISNLGAWSLYKIFPIELEAKLQNSKFGFNYKDDTPEYTIRTILKHVCKDLSKEKAFKNFVARYIFGMVKKGTWEKKVSSLESKVSNKKYSRFIDWMHTFAPDALCMTYMDLIYHAPKVCNSYCQGMKGEKTYDTSKFHALVKRAISVSNADIGDFLFLIDILPPDTNLKDKFLIKIPEFLVKYRSKYPLVQGKN